MPASKWVGFIYLFFFFQRSLLRRYSFSFSALSYMEYERRRVIILPNIFLLPFPSAHYCLRRYVECHLRVHRVDIGSGQPLPLARKIRRFFGIQGWTTGSEKSVQQSLLDATEEDGVGTRGGEVVDAEDGKRLGERKRLENDGKLHETSIILNV